jgi:hypothetical protein
MQFVSKTERDDDCFVSGINKNVSYYCSTVMKNDDMSGKEGKKYIDNSCKNRCFISKCVKINMNTNRFLYG